MFSPDGLSIASHMNLSECCSQFAQDLGLLKCVFNILRCLFSLLPNRSRTAQLRPGCRYSQSTQSPGFLAVVLYGGYYCFSVVPLLLPCQGIPQFTQSTGFL